MFAPRLILWAFGTFCSHHDSFFGRSAHFVHTTTHSFGVRYVLFTPRLIIWEFGIFCSHHDSFFWSSVVFLHTTCIICRFHWLCRLRRRSAVARLLELRVQIPPRTWMYVSCECCVLSGRGLCDRLITRPEESYQMLCV